MNTKSALALLAGCVLACGCGQSQLAESNQDQLRGTSVDHDVVIVRNSKPSDVEQPLASGEPLKIFVNRAGATYYAGNDDPRTNHSMVVGHFGFQQVTVPPFAGSNAEWSTYLQCIKDSYAPFNVVVTDTEPSSGTYIEISSGGSSASVFGQSFGGIAPLGCGGVSSSVVFVMTDTYPNNPLGACWAAAQESAHALGLDHEMECSDPMTYLSNCPLPKRFQDKSVKCGEFSEHPCTCTGQASQNSYQWIVQTVGASGSGGGTGGGSSCTPSCSGKTCGSADGCGGVCQSGSGCTAACTPSCAGKSCGASDGCSGICQVGSGCAQSSGDATPPTASITSPSNGAVLPANTQMNVVVTAQDNVAVASVQLVWEYTGETWSCPSTRQGVTCAQSGSTYTWTLTPGSGPRSFYAVVKDTSGNVGQSSKVAITLQSQGGLSASITSPGAGSAFKSGQSTQIVAQVTGGTAPYEVILNWTTPYGTTAYLMPQSSSGGTFVMPATFGVVGQRTFSVTAMDSSGQSTTTAPETINVQ